MSDGWRKMLVRIQVDAAVIPVAVVEMPVEHEHFVFLQVRQRLLAQIVVDESSMTVLTRLRASGVP